MSNRGRRVAAQSACSLIVSVGLLLMGVARLYPGGWLAVMRPWPLVVAVVSAVTLIGAGFGWMLFRSDKSAREVVADVLLVTLAQLVVLVAGLVVITQGAPVCMVWAVDHFEVVTAMEMRESERVPTIARQVSTAWSGLQLRRLELPQDLRTRQYWMFAELEGHRLPAQDALLAPYQALEVIRHIRSNSDISDLALRSQVQQAAQRQSVCPVADVGWLPLKSPHGFHTALVSRKDGRICDVLDLDLWDK